MTPEALKSAICKAFCTRVDVDAVPAGLAVTTDIVMHMGDPITFYMAEGPDGYACEDDGDFIATALASGAYVDDGARSETLDALLADHGAYLDRDTCQIRRDAVPSESAADAAMRFLPALIRSRDILLLSREKVASSFADDLHRALEDRLGGEYSIAAEEGTDNPADILLKDQQNGLNAALIYAVNSNDKLMAALVRFMERDKDDAPVIAMLADGPGASVSRRRFMMAQNRGLPMPFFAGDSESAVDFVRTRLKRFSA